jgi:6-pyruvoyltetrahydropterin/6-carboxytetrahydropterin synthase
LNDVLPYNPTAELIALYLYDYFKPDFPKLVAVSVKETPKTIARYAPES